MNAEQWKHAAMASERLAQEPALHPEVAYVYWVCAANAWGEAANLVADYAQRAQLFAHQAHALREAGVALNRWVFRIEDRARVERGLAFAPPAHEPLYPRAAAPLLPSEVA